MLFKNSLVIKEGCNLTKDFGDMASKYYSFLVRLWESEDDGDSTWHFSLESSGSGEKHYFANLGELMNFFENLILISKEKPKDEQ